MYKNLRYRKGKRANTHCKARWSGGIIRNSNQQTWEAFLCNCLYMGHSCCFHIITWVKIIMCNNYCSVYLKIQRQIYKCSHPSFGAVCFLTVLLFVHFLVYLYKQADTPRFNVCFFFVIYWRSVKSISVFLPSTAKCSNFSNPKRLQSWSEKD